METMSKSSKKIWKICQKLDKISIRDWGTVKKIRKKKIKKRSDRSTGKTIKVHLRKNWPGDAIKWHLGSSFEWYIQGEKTIRVTSK